MHEADFADTPSETPPKTPNFGHGDYTGDGKALFWLARRTPLLTLLSLGIYRFWGPTRVRRHIRSSARVGASRLLCGPRPICAACPPPPAPTT
ncbi:hypothetical protein AL036_11405 [Salipiger aestuarii]|uniref:DUF898 family protein n=1 Tax=Salipiger aestuarii TaxID=568098 RepID=UPI00025B5F38|nr:DUF898 family protein [Salipiger aestuarii]EIE52473.1 hypothetical protein C357_03470 [Citreicella sp. 357]KAA8607208.1 hypothetical protein AL036_11405 [Salipiger aestuarii]